MSALADQVVAAGYADRILTERQLARLLGGTEARRYGLVNRALKSGALERVKRGLYVLSNKYRATPAHPFRLAQALRPGSYVSMETALAFHGWIPEAVYATVSVVPGRKSANIDHPTFGRFAFLPLAVHRSEFLRDVHRVQIDAQTMLVAGPLRAFMDIVAYRKLDWRGLDWIVGSLRIDPATFARLRKKDLAALKSVYKHKSVNHYLARLQEEAARERSTASDTLASGARR